VHLTILGGSTATGWLFLPIWWSKCQIVFHWLRCGIMYTLLTQSLSQQQWVLDQSGLDTVIWTHHKDPVASDLKHQALGPQRKDEISPSQTTGQEGRAVLRENKGFVISCRGQGIWGR
jgi:hypothetical protein